MKQLLLLALLIVCSVAVLKTYSRKASSPAKDPTDETES